MTEIALTDVTIHIDKDADKATRTNVESGLRRIDGVVSVHMSEDNPHLVVVEYNPEKTNSSLLLTMVKELAGHAKMIGL